VDIGATAGGETTAKHGQSPMIKPIERRGDRWAPWTMNGEMHDRSRPPASPAPRPLDLCQSFGGVAWTVWPSSANERALRYRGAPAGAVQTTCLVLQGVCAAHADRCSRVDFHSGIHIPTRALCRCSSRWSNRALISGFIARMGGPESLLGGDGTASSLCIHMAVHRVVGEGRRRDVPRETQCDRHYHTRPGVPVGPPPSRTAS
jgi:hypothetical protein